MSERYAGVVDTVSGVMLARALAQVKYMGAAAVCGLAGGVTFPGNIMPFILRGISMYGIDSVMLPMQPRQEAWNRLATDLPLDKLDAMTVDAALGDVPQLDVLVLRIAQQDGERLIGAQVESLHEDALGLTDQLARVDRQPEILGPAGGGQRDPGVPSED